MEPTESFSSELPTALPTNQAKEGFRPVADRESYVDVPGLLVKFNRQSPVLHIVESLLYSHSQPPDSIQPLFSALANTDSRYWHEKAVAAWALGRMNLTAQEHDAAASMLLGILEEDGSQSLGHSAWVGINWSFWTVLCATMVMTTVGAIDQYAVFDFFLFSFACATLFTVPIAIVSGHHNSQHYEFQRAAAAESLGRLRSAEALGALSEALFDSNFKVSESAALALRLILPELTPNDAGRIDAAGMHGLGRILETEDVLLIFTTLEAIEKVGGSQAIPYVSRICKTGQTLLVRETAQRVLGVLEERKRGQGDARQLGRPVVAPPTVDQLLRPTASDDDVLEDI